MPRTYTPKPGGKLYKKYDEDNMNKALSDLGKGQSYRKVGIKYNIPKSVLQRHCRNTKTMKHGAPLSLSLEIENHMVSRLVTCAEWGYPLDKFELRCVVKAYLDRTGIKHPRFKNNMPGPDWAILFMKRHKCKISDRMSQNIKRSRANITRQ